MLLNASPKLCAFAVAGALTLLIGCNPSPQEDLSPIISDMEDDNAEKRYDALKYIEERVEKGIDDQDVEKSIDPLRKALRDSDPRVRYRAAKVLSKLKEKAAPAVEELKATLSDKDAKTRYYAAKSLAKIDDAAKPATKELIAALEDEDIEVRYFAAKALGNVKASDAVEALQRAADSGDEKLQEAAREALAEIRGSE